MAAKRKESKRSQRYPHSIWIAWTPVNQRWFLLQGKGPSDSIILDRFDTRAEAASAAERLTAPLARQASKRDPGHKIVIEFGAVPNSDTRRGGFMPAVWHNGRQTGDTYGRGYDKEEAIRIAKKEALEEKSRFVGDWSVVVKARPGSSRDPAKRGTGPSARRTSRDSAEATELLLYLDNDEPLYRRKKEFLKNVYAKMKRGTYSPALARKLWMYYVEEAAKKYEREFLNPGEWHQVFPPAVRREVAKELEERERKMIESGEYKDFSPVRVLHDPAFRGTGPASRRKGSGSRRKSR